MLQELAKLHVVPALIIEHRELFKLKSTYIDGLIPCINPETKRIHTNFSQTVAATGRLASSDPNMQNIPVETVIPGVHVRSAFKAPENHVFIAADYSQIELRVLAQLSGDSALKSAFITGEDIHARTAAALFAVALSAVTSEQRQVAKRINFSILYGLTPYGLSKDLDISFAQAKEYIEKYFEQYPGVVAWMEQIIEDLKKNGYVTTLWGRRRYIPGIYEKNRSLYDLARRIAINTVAQGTAAELMKKGMLALDREIKAYNLSAKIVLQIHDELLLSVPESEITQMQELVKTTLETVVAWDIPLTVTVHTGHDWYQVTK